MAKKTFRANATEINKTPRDVRLVWVIAHEDGSINTCMTYQTLARVRVEEVQSIKVVDLITNEVYLWETFKTDFPQMLEEWRDNYFNQNWAPSQSSS